MIFGTVSAVFVTAGDLVSVCPFVTAGGGSKFVARRYVGDYHRFLSGRMHISVSLAKPGFFGSVLLLMQLRVALCRREQMLEASGGALLSPHPKGAEVAIGEHLANMDAWGQDMLGISSPLGARGGNFNGPGLKLYDSV